MFEFKQFIINDSRCAMKVGTDGVLLGAWTDVSGASRVLDLGAGSGLLALMVAQRSIDALIGAVEIDANAAKDAEQNFIESPWAQRLCVICADANTYEPAIEPDLIISNPPFFGPGLHSPVASRADARNADCGFGPMEVLEVASRTLSPTGTVSLITPADIADELVFKAEMLRLHLWRRCDVASVEGKRPYRVLWQFCRKQHSLPTQHTAMAIRSGAEYTYAYRLLTKDFYLKI